MSDTGSSSGQHNARREVQELGLWGLASVAVVVLLLRMPPIHWSLELLLQSALWLWGFRLILLLQRSGVRWKHWISLLFLLNFALYSLSLLGLGLLVAFSFTIGAICFLLYVLVVSYYYIVLQSKKA